LRHELNGEIWETYQKPLNFGIQKRIRFDNARFIIHDFSRYRKGDDFELLSIDHMTVGAAFKCIEGDKQKVRMAAVFRGYTYCCREEELEKVMQMMETDKGKEGIRNFFELRWTTAYTQAYYLLS